jgi:hypothetical protein
MVEAGTRLETSQQLIFDHKLRLLMVVPLQGSPQPYQGLAPESFALGPLALPENQQ